MFLALYFVFLFLAVTSYIRTLWTVKTSPGYVPLHPTSRGARVLQNRQARRRRSPSAAFSRRYGADDDEAEIGYSMPDHSPDSPGLEAFYSRDVFVCESDGRPKWCHDCGQWKPDRASHSREIDRCVRKMDHFCPWVGGMVAENCKPPPPLIPRPAPFPLPRRSPRLQNIALTTPSLQVLRPIHLLRLALLHHRPLSSRLLPLQASQGRPRPRRPPLRHTLPRGPPRHLQRRNVRYRRALRPEEHDKR